MSNAPSLHRSRPPVMAGVGLQEGSPLEIEALRSALATCTAVARDWFLAHATVKGRSDWEANGRLGDTGIGAVYAFSDEVDRVLYVGQTTQKMKERANLQTSCHYDTQWWPFWRTVRFVNMDNLTDQLVLETLLILALSPSHNTKPAAREISQMWPNQALNTDGLGQRTFGASPKSAG